MREVENPATALGIPLLMDACDHLAVETMQQRFKLSTQHAHISAALLLAKTGAEHLITFFAAQLIKELIETEQTIRLAQYQVNGHINMQLLMHVLQPSACLTGQGFKVVFIAAQQGLHFNGDQHTVQRARTTAFVQQVEQRTPGTAIDVGILLGKVTPGSIDQHTMIGEVPVAVSSPAGIAGQFAINLVDRKLKPREVQQAGFATALRTNQQVPRQITAPAFATTAIQARRLQGLQRVLEARLQLLVLFVDLLFTADTTLSVFAGLDRFFAHARAPADKYHAQPPDQEEHADGQQP